MEERKVEEVIYQIAFPDVYPDSLKDLPAGFIENGMFYLYGTVARYFARLQREIPTKKKEFHVYFIQSEQGGPIKIGSASNVEQRLESLQTAHAYPLKIIAVFPHAGLKTEKMLHERFAKYRLNGEWFEWNLEIKEIIDGTNTQES